MSDSWYDTLLLESPCLLESRLLLENCLLLSSHRLLDSHRLLSSYRLLSDHRIHHRGCHVWWNALLWLRGHLCFAHAIHILACVASERASIYWLWRP